MQLTQKFSDIKFKYIFLIIVGIHIAVSLKEVRFPEFKKAEQGEESQIKIRLAPINHKSDRPMQIVETEKSKIKVEAKAKFLSKDNNTVDRQTRAKHVASFKKAGLGTSAATQESKQQSSASKKIKSKKKLSFSDLAIGNDLHKKNFRPNVKGMRNGDRSSTGLGSTNDFIQDIPLGDFTKLNTQEYEFYGFYHRIRQKLEQFWGRNIQEQAEQMFKSGRSLASDKNLLTSLSITLNSKGEIIAVSVNATSGIKELDQAAIKSFNEAGPFPNPPKKMLRNGVAKIEWGFVVNT